MAHGGPDARVTPGPSLRLPPALPPGGSREGAERAGAGVAPTLIKGASPPHPQRPVLHGGRGRVPAAAQRLSERGHVHQPQRGLRLRVRQRLERRRLQREHRRLRLRLLHAGVHLHRPRGLLLLHVPGGQGRCVRPAGPRGRGPGRGPPAAPTATCRLVTSPGAVTSVLSLGTPGAQPNSLHLSFSS